MLRKKTGRLTIVFWGVYSRAHGLMEAIEEEE